MHELGIMTGVMDAVTTSAQQAGATRVLKVSLSVGEMTEAIEQLAQKRNVSLVGRIPFDPVFTRSMVAGKTLFEYGEETSTHRLVREIWGTIVNSPSMNPLGIVDFKATIQ